MKKSLFLLVVSILFSFFSCGSDDGAGGEGADGTSKIPNKDQENVALSVSEVESNLLIKGSTLIESEEFPAKKGDVRFYDFDDQKEVVAFKRLGFSLRACVLTKGTTYKGVYLQVLSENGDNSSNSYYKIPHNSSVTPVFPVVNGLNRFDFEFDSGKPIFDLGTNVETDLISITFSNKMKAGRYKIIIAAYDELGNVSESKELSVKNLEWGGDKELLGSWSLKRQKEFINGSLVEDLGLGDKDCGFVADIRGCEKVEDCDIINQAHVNFNSNGTFYFDLEGINETTNPSTCINKSSVNMLKGNGYWTVNDNYLYAFLMNFEESFVAGTNVYDGDSGFLVLNGEIEIKNETLELYRDIRIRIINETHQENILFFEKQ